MNEEDLSPLPKRYAPGTTCRCPVTETTLDGQEWILSNEVPCGYCGTRLGNHIRHKHPHQLHRSKVCPGFVPGREAHITSPSAHCDICAADALREEPRDHKTRMCVSCGYLLRRHKWATHPHYLLGDSGRCHGFTEVLDESFEA